MSRQRRTGVSAISFTPEVGEPRSIVIADVFPEEWVVDDHRDEQDSLLNATAGALEGGIDDAWPSVENTLREDGWEPTEVPVPLNFQRGRTRVFLCPDGPSAALALEIEQWWDSRHFDFAAVIVNNPDEHEKFVAALERQGSAPVMVIAFAEGDVVEAEEESDADSSADEEPLRRRIVTEGEGSDAGVRPFNLWQAREVAWEMLHVQLKKADPDRMEDLYHQIPEGWPLLGVLSVCQDLLRYLAEARKMDAEELLVLMDVAEMRARREDEGLDGL